MGNKQFASADESTEKEMQALTKWMPHYVKAITGQIQPTEEAKYEASKELSPKYYQMAIDNAPYQKELNRIAQEQKATNQQAEIASDIKTLQGPGQQAAQEALNLAMKTDPEFFKQRGLISDKMGEVLGASSATLSPTERAEMERSIAQTGARDKDSAINTAKNAMLFGSAATNKANNLAKVVQSVSSSLPQLKSGLDIYGIATGRGGLSGNTGEQRYGAGFREPGQEAFSMGSQLGSQVHQTQQMADQQHFEASKTGMEMAQGIVDMTAKMGSTVGSFMAM